MHDKIHAVQLSQKPDVLSKNNFIFFKFSIKSTLGADKASSDN